MTDGDVALRRYSHTDKLGHEQTTNSTEKPSKPKQLIILVHYLELKVRKSQWSRVGAIINEDLFAWIGPLALVNEVKIGAWLRQLQ